MPGWGYVITLLLQRGRCKAGYLARGMLMLGRWEVRLSTIQRMAAVCCTLGDLHLVWMGLERQRLSSRHVMHMWSVWLMEFALSGRAIGSWS